MGIYIHLDVSASVTAEEWERVYEESLKLAGQFSLAEFQTVTVRGIDILCLVRTREREETYGWSHEETRLGWCAVGDYETMKTAERYYLPRQLAGEVEEDAGDAMLGWLPSCLNYQWDDDLCAHSYKLWRNKTQAEPYHLALLAIACMIGHRLGDKAFVYGDITRGQCIKAVEMANRYLSDPIAVPDRCDMEALHARVSRLPLTDIEKMKTFIRAYLGTEDAAFGEYLRGAYPQDICREYWKEDFSSVSIGTIGFDEAFRKYLLWGFDLRMLCGLLDYSDRDGNMQYEKFIRRVMDAKLHIREKNCRDALRIDQEEPAPYGIWTLFAQFAFRGARNPKIDRYIPLEELRGILCEFFSGKCDVDGIIDACLEEEGRQEKSAVPLSEMTEEELGSAIEQDASGVFNEMIEEKCSQLQEAQDKYDIAEPYGLIGYQNGGSLHPAVLEAAKKSFSFYQGILEEDAYHRLMEDSAGNRCRWLAETNVSLIIRDRDWEKIFADIEEHEEAFARYYPAVRVKMDHEDLIGFVEAVILNDAFYGYCRKLIENG